MAVNAVDDLQFQPGGVLLAILRSKTNEYAEGQLIAVVHGQVAATEPIAARDAWLQHRAPCRVDRSLACAESRSPLNRSPGRPSRSLRKGARAAGLAAERITAHSLCAGHATSAAVAGLALDRIAAQTRVKRLSSLIERYIRPAQAMVYASSGELGL